MSSSVTSSATATTSAASGLTAPPQFKVVGVVLAVVSGLLIGSSFVFKKKGLLASQAAAGEGVAYLKSPMWWTGMIMMIIGELCNFGSYAFIPAIIVTPLGALSVVICAILSSIFLKETLTFFGWIGCFLCIVGSVIIALNGPEENSASTIKEFQHLFLSLGFIIYGSIIILSALVIIFFFAPKYGKKNMLWYIMVCSLFGGLSVSCTQGLGSSIVTSIRGENQFKYWFIYFLLVFVIITLVTEIYYLNIALALFNTAMVTPTYYVIFTFFTLVTSVILYQGLHATVVQILTVVMGFLVICAGITILQMSKVDPTSLGKLDRKSTILLQASRLQTEQAEKNDVTGIEDPGMDALRGSFGTVGSIIRARSARLSLSTTAGSFRQRHIRDVESQGGSNLTTHGLPHLPRHQLYDAPVPGAHLDASTSDDGAERISMHSQQTYAINSPRPHHPSIRFEEGGDIAHYYPSPGRSGLAIHEQRPGSGIPPPVQELNEGDEDAFDPSHLPLPPSERFRPPQTPQGTRQPSDPFRDRGMSGSQLTLLTTNSIEMPTPRDSDDSLNGRDEVSSPEDMRGGHPLLGERRRRQSSNRSYPGRRASSDEEREARESLVGSHEGGGDPGPNRGGIRLLPSQSSPRR